MAVAAPDRSASAAATAWNVLGSREAERYRPLLEGTAGGRNALGAIEHVTVALAALDAFTAAVEAFGAVGYRNAGFVAAALDDHDRPLRMIFSRYPGPGAPIGRS